MADTLTEGALQAIVNGIQVDSPVLQIIEYRPAPAGVQGGSTRYRLLLSDGRNTFNLGILATQRNTMIDTGELTPFSVVLVKRYHLNEKDGKKLILVLDLEVIVPGSQIGQRISNPVPFDVSASAAPQQQPAAKPFGGYAQQPVQNNVRPLGVQNNHTGFGQNYGNSPGAPPAKRPNFGGNANSNQSWNSGNNIQNGSAFRPQIATYPQPPPGGFNVTPQHRPQTYQNQSNFGNQGGFTSQNGQDDGWGEGQTPQNIFPISALNVYNKVWTIKVKVLSKEDIRHFSNAKGDGQVFGMLLSDGETEIKASAFNAEAEKFHTFFEVGRSYYIKGGMVKNANSQYSQGRLYDLMLNYDTMAKICPEEVQTKRAQFRFTKIDSIATSDPQTNVDVIGQCTGCSMLNSGTGKQSGKEYKRRDLDILDDSNTSVRVSLWNQQAEKYDETVQGKIIAIKGCRLSSFGGCSLSASNDSYILLDPDIPEAHRIRGWIDHGDRNAPVQSISQAVGGGGFNDNAPWKSIVQVKEEAMGSSGNPEYFKFKGTIMKVMTNQNNPNSTSKERILYPSCATPNCKNKVMEDGAGGFSGNKCGHQNPNCIWRLMLNVEIADFGDGLFATMFDEQAQRLLGYDGAYVNELDPTECDKLLNSVQFQSKIFVLRVKMESYQDVPRQKFMVQSVTNIDYGDYAKKLETMMDQMSV